MEIKSRMPGVLMELKVAIGDLVEAKSVVAIMEAMKMKQAVPAPVAGTVKEIRYNNGDRVDAGSVIMVIE